ncbi:rab-GTPase-TBC domain-containing protein [Boletus coccyginus]|nr:rab-GTPase-TBC domain-containing protein [Boletus coccyginus]
MSPTNGDEQSWVSFRERSLQPGGFGEDRARIWPALLGAQPLSDPPPYSEVESTNEDGNQNQTEEEGMHELVAHADERQIKLDTDRSFVLYPGESGTTPARDALQSDLHGLLVSLFRKRRSLHYFQGFHDIMTVLFLTLPRPLHLACAEKMALHRVRDAMGVGLEPVLGLLRVLRNLLRLADPAYAKLLESTSPLPYHALSHLLTLFSHDVPTLPLIQHVWDFLLSREPIAVVWLAAALILHRKPSVYLLAEQDEDGMIHSLLGGMPELVDVEPEFYHTGNNEGTVTEVDRVAEAGMVSGRSIAVSRSNGGAGEDEGRSAEDIDRILRILRKDTQTRVSRKILKRAGRKPIQCPVPSDVAQSNDTLLANNLNASTEPNSPPKVTNQNRVGGPDSSTLELAASIPLPDSRPASPIPLSGPSSPVQSTTPLVQEATSVDHHTSAPSTSDHVPPHSHSSSDPTRSSPPIKSFAVENGPMSHFDKSAPSKSRAKQVPLSLPYLLRQADDLLTAYPSSHPSLRVTEILGPDSAMRTWRPLPISTVPEKLPYHYTDDYLETLVNSSCIVIPSPPPSPPPGPRLPVKKAKVSPRALTKALLDPRRIGLRRLGALTSAERRVLFVGALFVVGAAMALKSGKISYVDGIVKANGGDGVKRLWNGKWTLVSSMVAAWGRGLP